MVIATALVVATSQLLAVYLVFWIVSRDVPDDLDSEVEVSLLPPRIRRKVTLRPDSASTPN
jgi:hypothetical protein